MFTRYTIEGSGTNAFKLVEDKRGAWMQAVEVLAKVPRCDSCKLWTRNRVAPIYSPAEFGYCNVLPAFANIMSTRYDFGCVQWEAK